VAAMLPQGGCGTARGNEAAVRTIVGRQSMDLATRGRTAVGRSGKIGPALREVFDQARSLPAHLKARTDRVRASRYQVGNIEAERGAETAQKNSCKPGE
jgi:hypothetical protein